MHLTRRQKEILDFKLAPCLEQVGDKPSHGAWQTSWRMMSRVSLNARIRLDGIFGNDRWITYRPDSGWLGFDQLRTWLLDDTPLPVFLLMLAGIWFFMTILIMGFVYILIMGFVYKVFVRDP